MLSITIASTRQIDKKTFRLMLALESCHQPPNKPLISAPNTPIIAPHTAAIIPMAAPNKPAINPNNPPAIPIQIGNVNTRIRMISIVVPEFVLERVIINGLSNHLCKNHSEFSRP